MENIENKHPNNDIECLFSEILKVDHQQTQIHKCSEEIFSQKVEKFEQEEEIGPMLRLIQSRSESAAELNESQAISQKREELVPSQLEQSDDFHGFDFKDIDNEALMKRFDFVASIYGHHISNKLTDNVSGIQRPWIDEEDLNQCININYGYNSKIPPRLRHKRRFAAMTPPDLSQSINIHHGYNSKIPPRLRHKRRFAAMTPPDLSQSININHGYNSKILPRLRHKRRFAAMTPPESNKSTHVNYNNSSETDVKRKPLQLL